MDRDDPAYAGQREYGPAFLRIYDPLILGVFSPLVWRCPTTHLVEGYRKHVGPRHLDVGPGTGYFFERGAWPIGVLSPSSTPIDTSSITRHGG